MARLMCHFNVSRLAPVGIRCAEQLKCRPSVTTTMAKYRNTIAKIAKVASDDDDLSREQLTPRNALH
jgi:hypothetical protein